MNENESGTPFEDFLRSILGDEAAAEAAREAVAHARSVMGNVGREKAPTRVTYSSAEGSDSSAGAPKGNRAERRAAKKRRRR